MKILILADSRGMWPREYNWPMVFASLIGDGHEVHARISGIDSWLISIHMMEEYLLKTFPDEIFDLIIVQMGWHEGGPCFWPKETWEEIINTSKRKFAEENLTQEVENGGKKKYLYIDRETEKSIMQTFKSRSRNCLFVGMQSLRGGNDLDKAYKLGMAHHYETLKSNEAFSKDVDSLNFPMENQWVSSSCLPDGIHYNYSGVNYVSQYIARYFDRMDKTLNSVFSGTLNHKKLYDTAKKLGSAICQETSLKDVVLISGDADDNLMGCFLGCILYGRVPLIIQ